MYYPIHSPSLFIINKTCKRNKKKKTADKVDSLQIISFAKDHKAGMVADKDKAVG